MTIQNRIKNFFKSLNTLVSWKGWAGVGILVPLIILAATVIVRELSNGSDTPPTPQPQAPTATPGLVKPSEPDACLDQAIKISAVARAAEDTLNPLARHCYRFNLEPNGNNLDVVVTLDNEAKCGSLPEITLLDAEKNRLSFTTPDCPELDCKQPDSPEPKCKVGIYRLMGESAINPIYVILEAGEDEEQDRYTLNVSLSSQTDNYFKMDASDTSATPTELIFRESYTDSRVGYSDTADYYKFAAAVDTLLKFKANSNADINLRFISGDGTDLCTVPRSQGDEDVKESTFDFGNSENQEGCNLSPGEYVLAITPMRTDGGDSEYGLWLQSKTQ